MLYSIMTTMTNKNIRIASRNSPMALTQSEFIKAQLLRHHPDLDITIHGMTTEGDRRLTGPLSSVGGKGLFVKELEHALLNDEADIAVHSTKDMTVTVPKGLTIQTLCQRDDPRDVLVSNDFENLFTMPSGSKIGTSSLRRRCQLLHLRPDLHVISLRGNVQTRLGKLDDGEFDAIILAAAGLHRLGLEQRIRQYLSPNLFLPAVGQGVLCIECREDDVTVKQLLQPLHHPLTADCVMAERAMNQALNGGCHVPIAGYAILHNEKLTLRGLVGEPEGKVLLQATAIGARDQATQLGQQVAQQLLRHGADKILNAILSSGS